LLEATTAVSNPWLAAHFDVSSPFRVSKHVGRLRHRITPEAHRLFQRLEEKGKA